MGKWDGWEKQSGGDEPIHEWDLKDNKSLLGVYVSKRENVGSKNSNMYIIEKKDGNRVAIWGNKFLNDTFSSVQIGEEVGLEYLGKKTAKSGNDYHAFEIYRRPMQATSEKSSVKTDDIPF